MLKEKMNEVKKFFRDHKAEFGLAAGIGVGIAGKILFDKWNLPAGRTMHSRSFIETRDIFGNEMNPYFVLQFQAEPKIGHEPWCGIAWTMDSAKSTLADMLNLISEFESSKE